jgi:integrase
MSPHRKRRKNKDGTKVLVGSFAFDRIIRGVGRFRVASGTLDKKVFRRLNDMIDALLDQGRLDLIVAMKSGKLTMMQVYNAYRMGELDRLPSVDQLIPLRAALETFATTYECSAKHRESLWTFHRYVDEQAPVGAAVAVLPDVLKGLRETVKAKPRMFNILRSVAMAFTRSHYGKGSKLWLAVAQVETLKVTAKRIKHPGTVAELLTLCEKLPTTVWKDGVQVPCDFAGMTWTLATTGMRTIVEYFNVEWDVKDGWVEIGTGKKDKAVRRVPLIREPVIPECDYQVFADRIRLVSDGQMTPYDLRRTYANWLEAAQVPRTRRLIYMGHGAVDITGRYEWHEVKAFLAEDGEKVKGWLDAEIAKAQQANKPGLRVVK